ncbi:hypothetical protein ET495_15425 [Xylanimonas allomyrinae]|uniref:Uncharacterized protein n=1 Tax=Xylanimonas allomyrinae TaxID=2509459 RepID=A0A4P6F212_9MICO|nr:hypothetical protein [Xylanimonas allomyrinae]QAY64368.1 hypothetical protein ET495_15425 [Xylanimonas allomyrinae]
MSAPTPGRLVLAFAVGAAAVAFAVVVAARMFDGGVGTGDPLDPPRALAGVLADGGTWLVTFAAGAAGGVVGGFVALMRRRR